MKQILKALVGSRAQGLAGTESDYDWRGVFIHPTSELLRLNPNTQQTSWNEGKEDDVSFEVGHILFLATKSNPSVLEIFASEQYEADGWGERLRALFPYLWTSRGVLDAFCGYSMNQRKKLLDDKDGRAAKYACAYLRTLYNADQLLRYGTFSLNVHGTLVEGALRRYRNGQFTPGEVIDHCNAWQDRVQEAYKDNPDKQTNMEAVNEFLLDLRRSNW